VNGWMDVFVCCGMRVCGVEWCMSVSASACVHDVALLLFLSSTY
jgi:hypothetical protein